LARGVAAGCCEGVAAENREGSRGLAAKIDDHDAALRVGLVVVDAAFRRAGGRYGKLELRLLFFARSLSLFAPPDLLDDERGKHRALLDDPIRIVDRKP
jgi:hypothetical protein